MLAEPVGIQITVGAAAAVGGGLALAGILWVIRTLARLSKEFAPNGGSSLRDSVDTIIAEGRARDVKLDEVNLKIETHVAEHRGAQRSGLIRFQD